MRQLRYTGFILLLTLLLPGCGIEQTITLLIAPTALVTSLSSATFEFLSPIVDPALIGNFKGYELYYKFYNDYTGIGLDGNINNLTDLTGAGGFRRASRVEDSERIFKPLLPVPDAYQSQELRFIIDFFSLDNVTVSAYLNADLAGGTVLDTVGILREVQDEEENYKSFADIASDDPDFSPLDAEQDIYLALYVFSYGISSDLNEIYSEPEFLDYIQLN